MHYRGAANHRHAGKSMHYVGACHHHAVPDDNTYDLRTIEVPETLGYEIGFI
jgi:hypothetical protein